MLRINLKSSEPRFPELRSKGNLVNIFFFQDAQSLPTNIQISDKFMLFLGDWRIVNQNKDIIKRDFKHLQMGLFSAH